MPTAKSATLYWRRWTNGEQPARAACEAVCWTPAARFAAVLTAWAGLVSFRDLNLGLPCVADASVLCGGARCRASVRDEHCARDEERNVVSTTIGWGGVWLRSGRMKGAFTALRAVSRDRNGVRTAASRGTRDIRGFLAVTDYDSASRANEEVS
jgi:hypothetical protein